MGVNTQESLSGAMARGDVAQSSRFMNGVNNDLGGPSNCPQKHPDAANTDDDACGAASYPFLNPLQHGHAGSCEEYFATPGDGEQGKLVLGSLVVLLRQTRKMP